MNPQGEANLLITDFCNINTFDHRAILELQQKHNVFYNEQGKQEGFEAFCFSKRDSKKRHFALIENQKIIESKARLEKCLPEWRKPLVVLPTEVASRELFYYLKASQNEFKQFITGFPKGLYGIEYINKLVNDLMRFFGLKFKMTSKSWLPQPSYEAPYLHTLEDYIYWEIVSLFLQLKSKEVFQSIMRCDRCNAFFQTANNKRSSYYCPGCRRPKRSRANTIRKKRNSSAKHHIRKIHKAMAEDRDLLRESRINVFMHNLHISRQEAIALWEDDQNI